MKNEHCTTVLHSQPSFSRGGGSTGVSAQGLAPASQAHSLFSCSASTSCVRWLFFRDRVSLDAQTSLDHYPPLCTFLTQHATILPLVEMESQEILPGLALNCDPLHLCLLST
jgi:hypothetical protein